MGGFGPTGLAFFGGHFWMDLTFKIPFFFFLTSGGGYLDKDFLKILFFFKNIVVDFFIWGFKTFFGAGGPFPQRSYKISRFFWGGQYWGVIFWAQICLWGYGWGGNFAGLFARILGFFFLVFQILVFFPN